MANKSKMPKKEILEFIHRNGAIVVSKITYFYLDSEEVNDIWLLGIITSTGSPAEETNEMSLKAATGAYKLLTKVVNEGTQKIITIGELEDYGNIFAAEKKIKKVSK